MGCSSRVIRRMVFVGVSAFAVLACTSTTINQTESPKKGSDATTKNQDIRDTTSTTLMPPPHGGQLIELEDTTVNFLWREDVYDKLLSFTTNTIVIDENYARTISDPEKAVLGYVATFIGNECNWDGQATASRSNLKCRILSILKLGYQCSGTHLGFLKQWFREDSAVLKKLDNCPTTPDGSTIQETFDRIDFEIKGNKIVISYDISGFNTREGKGWTRKAVDHFVFSENYLLLVKTDAIEPVVTGFEINEN